MIHFWLLVIERAPAKYWVDFSGRRCPDEPQFDLSSELRRLYKKSFLIPIRLITVPENHDYKSLILEKVNGFA
jgi:hypothetical protein